MPAAGAGALLDAAPEALAKAREILGLPADAPVGFRSLGRPPVPGERWVYGSGPVDLADATLKSTEGRAACACCTAIEPVDLRPEVAGAAKLSSADSGCVKVDVGTLAPDEARRQRAALDALADAMGGSACQRGVPLREVGFGVRPILYTDTVGGRQALRDDLWAVTSGEVRSAAAFREEAIRLANHVLDLRVGSNEALFAVQDCARNLLRKAGGDA